MFEVGSMKSLLKVVIVPNTPVIKITAFPSVELLQHENCNMYRVLFGHFTALPVHG